MDLKARPIVGRPKCPTHKLSNFIDMMHNLFVKHIPGYIKDGLDSVNKCKGKQSMRLLLQFSTSGVSKPITDEFNQQSVDYFLSSFSNDLHHH